MISSSSLPLTSDYSAADLFLSAANVNSVPEQGTAIAPAINLAVKSFDISSRNDPSDKAERVIVIFSDGGDHEGKIQDAIDNAKKNDIKIYTVGFGSVEGAPIPIYNDQGQQIGFKKDDKGNIVLAKLHQTELKDIASGTGGRYFRAANGRDELEIIYGDLSKIRKSELGEKRVTDYEDRFYYFLAPAILLLLVEFFMSERRSLLFGMLNRKFGLEQ
ncbi:MAG: VWA domain-containing protein [Bacteroidetes bacterium]|nr:VWA domain-containing protein [Bacteroidota bacterium]